MNHFELLLLALLLDAALGEPDWLWKRVPHPVRLFGIAIETLDKTLNRGVELRAKGALAVGLLVIGAAIVGHIISLIPDFGFLEMLGAAVLLAHRSLIDHIKAVSASFTQGIGAARKSVANIVGRDVDDLDESNISRATIESAAENFSDGVIAPAFWFLIFGLPGILIYKLVNTADSMIGHMNPRYEQFGWAAARLDDLLNWIPARLTAGLICVAYASREAWQTVTEDAYLHRSPNAGWPEAAMAGVLGVALSGPRSYDGQMTRDSWLNASGRRELRAADIDRSVGVLWRSWFVLVAGLALMGLLISLFT